MVLTVACAHQSCRMIIQLTQQSNIRRFAFSWNRKSWDIYTPLEWEYKIIVILEM